MPLSGRFLAGSSGMFPGFLYAGFLKREYRPSRMTTIPASVNRMPIGDGMESVDVTQMTPNMM